MADDYDKSLFAGLEVNGEVIPQNKDQKAREVVLDPEMKQLFQGLNVGGVDIPKSAEPVQQVSESAPVSRDQLLKMQETVVSPAESGLGALSKGFERGLQKTGAGILQRGSQALNSLGIDTGEFLNELQQSERINQQMFKPTQKQSPILSTTGEIVGEAVGLPLPAQTLKGAAAAGAAIGGLQYGEEGTASEFASNVLLNGSFGIAGQFGADKLVGMTKAAARKLGLTDVPNNLFSPDGTLKSEAKDYLAKEGITLDDLSDSVIGEVEMQPQGSSLGQTLRAAQAKELGVQDLTKGDISQSFVDQSTEFRLAKQRGTQEAEALRQTKAAQNQQIIAAGENIIRGTGGEADKLTAGRTIQEALRGSKQARREAVTQLYNIAENEAGFAIPVNQEQIASEFFEQDFLFGIDPDVGGQLKAVKKQLEVFSILPPEILTSEADIRRIRPLTIGSAEQLRKNIRALISETDPKSQRALSPIIDSIDQAIDEIVISDGMGEAAQQAFKKARQARAQLAKDFEAKDIVASIVSFKTGTQTDKIPPSLVFDKVIQSSARVENTALIKKSLLEAGADGQKAWQDIKATTASELIGKALTTGKTASGDMRFSGANFNKALKNIGDDTLKQIFDGAGELARIKQLARISRDLTILQDGVFTPSGAEVENILAKIVKLPVFRLAPIAGAVINEGATAVSKGSRKADLRNVINPKIDVDTAESIGGLSIAAINAIRLLAISGQRKATEDEK
tara:strand:- start:1363 stop:3576 length:2214 start_codon:yes stop_codon:yes gene_type:complete